MEHINAVKDSRYEIQGPAPSTAYETITTRVYPTSCWFNILYHQPRRFLGLLDEASRCLSAYMRFENVGYIQHTLAVLKAAPDDVHLRFQVIFLYVTLPPIRALFKPHCSQIMWILAQGYLHARCREWCLQVPPLQVSRDMVETWVDVCLQPLALQLMSTILLTWDSGYPTFAYRSESGSVGVDEVIVVDVPLSRLSTLRQKKSSLDGGEAYPALAHMKGVADTSLDRLAKSLNVIYCRSPDQSAKVENALISEIYDPLLFPNNYVNKAVIIAAMSRPNRSGTFFPMDKTRPWMPSDALKTLETNYMNHQAEVNKAIAFRKQLKAAAVLATHSIKFV